MQGTIPYLINLRGTLMDLAEPRVMGILNVTPDSFFADSRRQGERAVAERVEELLGEGADIIDVGACSTRPGAAEVGEEEEASRLSEALRVIRREFPEAIVSIDTFRASIARRCVEDYGADIINDISGGADPHMFQTVASLGTPYVLTHNGQLSATPMADVMRCFAERVHALRQLGQKDIILDPGFGFGKTLEQNYQLLAHLADLKTFGLPLLAGVSRKRMIYNLLGTTPEQALNGTTAAHTLALMQGASILRAHDVREAKEAIKIVRQCWESA